MTHLFLKLLIFLTITSCSKKEQEIVAIPPPEHHKSVRTNYGDSQYQLDMPDKVISLSYRLAEISGLTYDANKNELLAINDEQGIIFRIDINTGNILGEKRFGGKGDYEGIECVDSTIYVLESTGRLSQIEPSNKKNKLRTGLRIANDLEGLGYDRTNHALLLACKGKANVKANQQYNKLKAVYSFDLERNQLSSEPTLKIKDEALESFIINQLPSISSQKKKKLLKRIKSFAPSAIAQHPIDDQFYILSSIGKSLLVIDLNDTIISITFLDKAIHRQPEGICFDPKGNMFISNEGKTGVAKIYKYELE